MYCACPRASVVLNNYLSLLEFYQHYVIGLNKLAYNQLSHGLNGTKIHFIKRQSSKTLNTTLRIPKSSFSDTSDKMLNMFEWLITC